MVLRVGSEAGQAAAGGLVRLLLRCDRHAALLVLARAIAQHLRCRGVGCRKASGAFPARFFTTASRGSPLVINTFSSTCSARLVGQRYG